VPPPSFFFLQKEKAKDKKKVFKPYRGKLKSASVKNMTESLDETEMKMLAKEVAKSDELGAFSSTVLAMPNSCSSILKVSCIFLLLDFFFKENLSPLLHSTLLIFVQSTGI
jgi:hypothetical protein